MTTKYKKELVLMGYTNMPTIKRIVSKKTGNTLKTIDNFEIITLKTALNVNKYAHMPILKIVFTITYTRKDNGELLHTSVNEKFTNLVDRKIILQSIREYQKKNSSNECKIFTHYDENGSAIYCDTVQVCTYTLKVIDKWMKK